MRKSLGSTKPKGEMKVKVLGPRQDPGPSLPGRTASPSGCSTSVAQGGARAYTLGPERW